MTDDRRETLLKEYTEVGQTFRLLTDIRFKLLAFLPLAAGVAGAVVSRTTPQPATLAFSVFGLVVTLGLITYKPATTSSTTHSFSVPLRWNGSSETRTERSRTAPGHGYSSRRLVCTGRSIIEQRSQQSIQPRSHCGCSAQQTQRYRSYTSLRLDGPLHSGLD